MTPERFREITNRYSTLRLALVGDFCLDRYLEIDPAQAEVSLETGLPVHNVVRVRSQPGGAGTILNNLVALGVGEVWPVGFCGVDGEGFELRRALGGPRSVRLDHFLETNERRTFTYCKPLIIEPGRAPQELNRLDSKNWSPTPEPLAQQLANAVRALADSVDAMIVLDQVDRAETGVVTGAVRQAIREIAGRRPESLILADSRRSLRDFPSVDFKMNRAELATLLGAESDPGLDTVREHALRLARQNGRRVFVTLSERGISGADPQGRWEHVSIHPLRGEIDIVGAGDAVTANLAAALAANGSLRESLEMANAAASVVVHQLGTTGTATVAQLAELLYPAGGSNRG